VSGPPAGAEAFVGLGANVGDRLAAFRSAVAALDAVAGVRVAAASAVYETEAHVLPGQPPQPDHLNAVVRVVTGLSPEALLDVLHAVEREAGRDRAAPPWSPRPLDLDLLLWGDLVLCTPAVTLPHPGIAGRRFVLQPLADLAPDLVVPGLGRTVADLLAATPDPARIVRTPFRLGLPRR
jgi:2-amino-4-hydroxy-6-hydroxymethyldihydropteridine diphosphokinase